MQLDCSYCGLVVDWFLRSQKVDLLNGRKACWNAPIFKTMKQQSKDVQLEFNGRLTEVITQFENQGLNTELYYTMRKGGKLSICFPQGQSGAISICRCIVKQACLIKMVGNYRDGVTFWQLTKMELKSEDFLVVNWNTCFELFLSFDTTHRVWMFHSYANAIKFEVFIVEG